MNVVQFFRNQTRVWNAEAKCGFCWDFGAPLSLDVANAQKQDKTPDNVTDCCVYVLITNLRLRRANTFASSTGFLNGTLQDHIVTVQFLLPAPLGQNMFNESPGHPEDESKYNEIVWPLQQCITEASILEFCRLIGRSMQIPSWDGTVVHNDKDRPYTGWSITMTLRDDGSAQALKSVIPVNVLDYAGAAWSGTFSFQIAGGVLYSVEVTNGKGVLINLEGPDDYEIIKTSGPGMFNDQTLPVPDIGINLVIAMGGDGG